MLLADFDRKRNMFMMNREIPNEWKKVVTFFVPQKPKIVSCRK